MQASETIRQVAIYVHHRTSHEVVVVVVVASAIEGRKGRTRYLLPFQLVWGGTCLKWSLLNTTQEANLKKSWVR
ncbi:hypothetical protein M0804_000011 [Polistes exclamans]|nr:hypothetical protein M0804_000011 [Polistes exclamans]